MKKVLIIWPGKQGKKYIHYFLQKWYIIDLVSRSVSYQNPSINKHFSSQHLQNFWIKELHEYTYIVISVAPIKEQEKIIEQILTFDYNWKIIIEKPIASDHNILKKVCKNENVFVFIDELILKNIIPWTYSNINIFAYNYDVFDHAIWMFLESEKFNNKKIRLIESSKYWNNLNYKIYADTDIIECKRWIYYFNKKEIYNLDFSKSLEYVLGLDKKSNLSIKKNFLHYLQEFF